MVLKHRSTIIVIGMLILVATTSVFADIGYITTYSHHMNKGEVEIMIMNDFTNPSKHKREDGQGDYFSQMLELEYYPTNQLALEFMWEWFADVITKETRFTGFRYEARYKVFEDEFFFNPTLYAEYEDLDIKTRYKMEVSGWVNPPYDKKEEVEPNREKIMETRFILSQDIGGWNVAFNWINESDLNSRETAFGYAMGVCYFLYKSETEGEHIHQQSLFQPMSLNFELVGSLGDTINLGLQPQRQEHYFQPSIMVHIGETMLSLGFAVGLTESSDDLVRLSTGWEF